MDSAETAAPNGGDPEAQAGAGAAVDSSPAEDAETRPSKSKEELWWPIVFVDHTGKRFIFPFERCKTYSSLKRLIEETYTRNGDQEFQDDVQQGKYDLLTIDNEVILPALWETILRSSLPLQRRRNHGYWHTVKISLWSQPIPLEPETRRGRYAFADTEDRPVEGLRIRRRSTTRFSDEESVDERAEWRYHRRGRSSSPLSSSGPRSSEDESGTSTDAEDTDSETASLSPQPAITPTPAPREAVLPLDMDGNQLSCTIDATRQANTLDARVGAENSEDRSESISTHDMKLESPLRILKTIQVSSEQRSTIQIFRHSGPERSSTSPNVGIRWYHLYGEQLDFAQFKSTCLGVQDVSDRMRALIAYTLGKIEKDKLRAFLDGNFIEPGTVFRSDDSDPDHPQSVIFSCVPHFEIQSPRKLSALAKADRLHPPRTLMQALYPYEPVRDRDEEQAIRKFKSDSQRSPKGIIHVPSLWIMNIGARVVVTCGYRPLSHDFVKSITVVREDIISLNSSSSVSDPKNSARNGLMNIRLTDWEGRILLYTPEECRTYFQVEQRVRELRFLSRDPMSDTLELEYAAKDGARKLEPRHWTKIINSRDSIFIDISVVERKPVSPGIDAQKYAQLSRASQQSAVPPFFYWRHEKKKDQKPDDPMTTQQVGSIPLETKRATYCLEQVEKAIMSETLDLYSNDIEEEFYSTDYFKALPESTIETVKAKFASLLKNTLTEPGKSATEVTLHEIIVKEQCSDLTKEAPLLVNILHQTLTLFVADVDDNTALRKVWGAMMNISTVIEDFQKRGDCKPDPAEYIDPEWSPPLTKRRGWFIRRRPKSSLQQGKFPHLMDNARFMASLRRCKKCKRLSQYANPGLALEHLRKHYQTSFGSSPPKDAPGGKTIDSKLQDCVRNHDQVLIEDTNEGCLVILRQATEYAMSLLKEVEELADGVKREDGKMLELYKFPHELLKSLQRLLLYYMSVERSIHFQHKDSEAKKLVSDPNMGLTVIRRFCESAKTSLLAARKDLCSMVRSSDRPELGKRLSLSAEYVCAWFMRRLLVKSVDNNSTVADLYREYLSTLQYQTNHRPQKRLLRSINLVQEELSALQEVTGWQIKAVFSYSRVLDDATYQKDIPSRRAMYPYERLLLASCLDNLFDANEDYSELIRRCGPLLESTKQSVEINEEDHGKAILVFTVVTIIFLPLSFVTSYLGMNTSDIRDMASKQSLFWKIAIPLTTLTISTMLLIAYNGDSLRSQSSAIYRRLTGKQNTSAYTKGISVAQRKRAFNVQFHPTLDEAEFAPPRPGLLTAQYLDDAEKLKSTERMRSTSLIVHGKSIRPSAQYHDELEPLYLKTAGRTKPTPMIKHKRPFRSGDLDVDAPVYFDSGRHAIRSDPAAVNPLPGFTSRPSHQEPPQSTAIKIRRRHLEPDTLAYYNLPWEYDTKDPEYYRILRDFPDTEMLFEHTARLREGRAGKGGKSYYDEHDRAVHGFTDYAWVRKKEKGKGKEKKWYV